MSIRYGLEQPQSHFETNSRKHKERASFDKIKIEKLRENIIRTPSEVIYETNDKPLEYSKYNKHDTLQHMTFNFR